MAERDNWLDESVDSHGTTTFIVKQRNRDHLGIIGKSMGGALAFLIVCSIIMSMGGGWMIVGAILGLFALLLGFLITVSCIFAFLASMGLRERVSFAITPDRVNLIEKVKDKYPASVDRGQVASLYVDGPRDSGQVSSSRVIVGPTAYVAAQAAAQTVGDISSGVGRGMALAVFASRFTVTINAASRKIHLTNNLSQQEAEYLMHRVELAWAR